MSARRKALLGKTAVLAVLCAALALMYLLGLPCPLQRLFGIPCPGCGMTRAVFLLLRGDPASALAMHGMVWSLPVLAVLFYTDARPFSRRWANLVLVASVGAGFLLNWLCRLLPLLA